MWLVRRPTGTSSLAGTWCHHSSSCSLGDAQVLDHLRPPPHRHNPLPLWQPLPCQVQQQQQALDGHVIIQQAAHSGLQLQGQGRRG